VSTRQPSSWPGPDYNTRPAPALSLHARYEAILAAVLDAACECYGPRLLALAVYGSVGRGTMREDSDVDLLVVARSLPRGRFPRVEEWKPIDDRVAPLLEPRAPGSAPIELSPVFRTPDELEGGGLLYLDMTEDARILHDPEGVLAGFLERFRARLNRLGARRIWRGNAWYWDLKPDYQPGEVFEI
jgi:predicted nucleotidyltransferase